VSSAQLYYEDVQTGDDVRPLYFYMDQMGLIEWGCVSGNSDAGHWHIWHNRSREETPTETSPTGHDPSVTGQYKTALMEKMIMDWAGPKARGVRMAVQYRVWDHFFELKTFSGTVTGKHEEGDDRLVDLDVEMAREDGRTTTRHTATVSLPSRAGKGA